MHGRADPWPPRYTQGRGRRPIDRREKNLLVVRNLRDALDARAITLESVFNLIRDAEENGNQHICYFRPKTKKLTEALTLDFLATNLWGPQRSKVTGAFPAIRLTPNAFMYADLRQHNPRKPKDWLMKIYGDTLITRPTGKVEDRGDNLFWKEFKNEPLRIVLLARWNSPDLLELRVQRDESRKRIDAWFTQLWSMLRPALIPEQFIAWDLDRALAKLVLNQDKNEAVYEFRDASVMDEKGGVRARFESDSDQGNLWASARTKESLQAYVKDIGNCEAGGILWKPQPSGTPAKELRTLIGARRRNEIIVPSHCPAGDLEYVTDQLRTNSK